MKAERIEAKKILYKHIGDHVVFEMHGKTILLDSFNAEMLLDAMEEHAQKQIQKQSDES